MESAGQRLQRARGDLIDAACAADAAVPGGGGGFDPGPVAVVVHEGAGLGVVDLEALSDGFVLVVFRLWQCFAGQVVLAVDLWRVEPDVVGATAGRVRAAAAHALEDGLEGHVDFEDVIEPDACGLQRIGLPNGAGKTVEQKALGAVRLRDALFDQIDDDVVTDQGPRVHHRLGLQAQWRAGLDGGAQHVAGGDLRDAVSLADEARLRALSGAGGAQQNQSHGNPQRLWRTKPLDAPCARDAVLRSRIACGLRWIRGRTGRVSRHRSSVICRSALAIGAQRGVAALADTLGARYGLRAACDI